jgi:protein TonB
MWDITNQYVATGFSGGVLPFIFFVAVIVYGFKYVGRARLVVKDDKKKEFFFWALGAAIFAAAAAFFGVIFFDQIQIAWYAILAMVSAATADLAVRQPESHASNEMAKVGAPSPVLTVSTVSAPGAKPFIGVPIQLPKSQKRPETIGKMAPTSNSKEEVRTELVDPAKEASLQARDSIEAPPKQMRLGKPKSTAITQPPSGKRTDEWIGLALELTSPGFIADHQDEGRRRTSLRLTDPADLPAAPLVPVPAPIVANDAVIVQKPTEEPPSLDPPEPCDKAASDAKPKIALTETPVQVSARVDTILWNESTEVTLVSDTPPVTPSQSSTIVSNRNEKPQAVNPSRTKQVPAASYSPFGELLTKVRELPGIKCVAHWELGCSDPPSIVKSTEGTPKEMDVAKDEVFRQILPVPQAQPAEATDQPSELPSVEILAPTASVSQKTVDSRAELSPRVASWLAGCRLWLDNSLGVAVSCFILAVAYIALGFEIGRNASERASNIAGASNDAARVGSSHVDTPSGKSLISKPIASADLASNNRVGSAVELTTQGQISRAIPPVSRNGRTEIPISPSPMTADQKSAATRPGSAKSSAVPAAISANSNTLSATVIPPTLGTPFRDSRGDVPPVSNTAPRAGEWQERALPSHLIYRVEPLYPKEALQQRLEGTVRIHVTVGLDGRVKGLSVVSGPALLTSAALDAAQYWPALRNGEPVETEEDISIDFRLRY